MADKNFSPLFSEKLLGAGFQQALGLGSVDGKYMQSKLLSPALQEDIFGPAPSAPSINLFLEAVNSAQQAADMRDAKGIKQSKNAPGATTMQQPALPTFAPGDVPTMTPAGAAWMQNFMGETPTEKPVGKPASAEYTAATKSRAQAKDVGGKRTISAPRLTGYDIQALQPILPQIIASAGQVAASRRVPTYAEQVQSMAANMAIGDFTAALGQYIDPETGDLRTDLTDAERNAAASARQEMYMRLLGLMGRTPDPIEAQIAAAAQAQQ